MTFDAWRVAVLYTLAGAAAGVLLNVLCFANEDGRTDLGLGTQLTVFGMLAGGFAGSVFANRVLSRPQSAGRLVACGALLLAALVGASMGWVVGDIQSEPYHREEELTRSEYKALVHRAMLTGSGIGTAVGLLILVPRWLRRRRNPLVESISPDRPS
jgi:hypothetical protein